jgi:Arc/MetJ family transcription regulator
MRTTVNLDTDLLAEASRLTGMTERTALLNAGLRALIERESARRLVRLGGGRGRSGAAGPVRPGTRLGHRPT